MRATNEHRRSSQPCVGLPAGMWSLAALSVAACLCSVLGAKLLSNMFEPPGAPAGARPLGAAFPGATKSELRVPAKSAPHVEAPAPTEQRNANIDPLPTGTISPMRQGHSALTPCGAAADH
ncbi:hypothetical protein FEV16_03150 [Methylocystis sp. B8]|nr:hypothetical protein FEV16_03150 [Methylocystis sp. B8]